jgi:hypothetical protein
MAKRTRIIEGTWSCTSCGAKDIPARHRKCPTCNNPREESGQESEFNYGEVDAARGKSRREGVVDPKALEAAAAGEDWFCEYCQASNRGDQSRCHNCHAERSAASRKLSSGPVEGAPPPRPQAPPRKASSGWGKWVLGALALSCLCFSGFAWWGSRTHEVGGTVARTEWSRTVYLDTFSRVSRSGWRDELRPTPSRMPVNGAGEVAGVENIRGCASRQRGTRQVADGTERVCRTKTRKVACGTEEKCTRRTLGNGFVEETCEDVTKYCNEDYEECRDETRYRSEPVYVDSCTYDTYEWKPVGSRTASGTNDAPRWPELPGSPSAVDRLRKEEQYTVRIEYQRRGPQAHELRPGSEQEFLAWRPGQSVTLDVSNLGQVKAVRPAAR